MAVPLSRAEAILHAKKDKTEYKHKPLSRLEEDLLDLDTGGGGGDEGSEGNVNPNQDFETMDVDDIMSEISTDNDEEESPDVGFMEDDFNDD